MLIFQILHAIIRIERIHLQIRCINQEPGTNKLAVHVMVAQHMTNVLTQEAFNALAEFLHAVRIRLLHVPRTIRVIRLARFEFADVLLDFVVPRHIRDQIANQRERFHRLHGNGLVERNLTQPRHAHQPRHSVDFRRARSALARFAVPAHGKITGLLRLNLMDGIKHDHAFCNRRRVFLEFARSAVAAPDLKRCGSAHPFISSMICFMSSVMGGSGSRRKLMDPSASRLIT